MKNKRYACIRVQKTISRENSPIGKKLKLTNYCITVEKTPGGLLWSTQNLYIPVKYVSDVVFGDITEYFL